MQQSGLILDPILNGLHSSNHRYTYTPLLLLTPYTLCCLRIVGSDFVRIFPSSPRHVKLFRVMTANFKHVFIQRSSFEHKKYTLALYLRKSKT